MPQPRLPHALGSGGRCRHGDGGSALSEGRVHWDEPRLRAALAEVPWIREIVLLTETGSTNDTLRSLAAAGAAEGTVVAADRQTAGRGRRGRFWFSPPGLGLYLSALFRPRLPAVEAGRWTLAAAEAACRACREVSGAPVVIKWPNDLRWRGLKLGGSLVELRTTGEGGTELVVGTGFNVYHLPEDFPTDLRGRAGSLAMACGGKGLDRGVLGARYLRRLGELVAGLRRGEWSEIARAWSALAPEAEGARVRIVSDPRAEGGGYEGTTRGIDDTGALRVERDDGTLVTVHQGESVKTLGD